MTQPSNVPTQAPTASSSMDSNVVAIVIAASESCVSLSARWGSELPADNPALKPPCTPLRLPLASLPLCFLPSSILPSAAGGEGVLRFAQVLLEHVFSAVPSLQSGRAPRFPGNRTGVGGPRSLLASSEPVFCPYMCGSF